MATSHRLESSGLCPSKWLFSLSVLRGVWMLVGSLPHSSLLACYLPLLLPIAVCPCLDLFLFSCPALIVCFLLFFLSAKPTVLKWLYSWAPKVKKNPKSLLSSLPQSLCLYSAPSLLSYQLEVSMLINFMLHISLVAEDGLRSQVACC